MWQYTFLFTLWERERGDGGREGEREIEIERKRDRERARARIHRILKQQFKYELFVVIDLYVE